MVTKKKASKPRVVYPKLHPGTTRQNEYQHRQTGIFKDKLGGVCAECGTVEYLEIHHIKGADLAKGRPFAERLRDWKIQIEKDNLMLLCYECHNDITHHRPTLNMSRREGEIKRG